MASQLSAGGKQRQAMGGCCCAPAQTVDRSAMDHLNDLMHGIEAIYEDCVYSVLVCSSGEVLYATNL